MKLKWDLNSFFALSYKNSSCFFPLNWPFEGCCFFFLNFRYQPPTHTHTKKKTLRSKKICERETAHQSAVLSHTSGGAEAAASSPSAADRSHGASCDVWITAANAKHGNATRERCECLCASVPHGLQQQQQHTRGSCPCIDRVSANPEKDSSWISRSVTVFFVWFRRSRCVFSAKESGNRKFTKLRLK